MAQDENSKDIASETAATQTNAQAYQEAAKEWGYSIPERCNYCGHTMPQGIFSECPRCRDQFAMAALTGIAQATSQAHFHGLNGGSNTKADSGEMARISYSCADAMLEARKRK